MRHIWYIAMLAILIGCTNRDASKIGEPEFIKIVDTISEGWNTGNAQLAAMHFSENAVYEEPPKKQFYKGQKNIFEFFGGDEGHEIPMKMKWHNLAFNYDNQIGFGEYTFAMNNQYHGIVVMQFTGGKISKWREYQYPSPLTWDDFTGESRFETEK